MYASYHVPSVVFWICSTCVNATDMSGLTRYSKLGGWLLNWPPSNSSIFESTLCQETVGWEGAILAIKDVMRRKKGWVLDVLALTNEVPKETTLLFLL